MPPIDCRIISALRRQTAARPHSFYSLVLPVVSCGPAREKTAQLLCRQYGRWGIGLIAFWSWFCGAGNWTIGEMVSADRQTVQRAILNSVDKA